MVCRRYRSAARASSLSCVTCIHLERSDHCSIDRFLFYTSCDSSWENRFRSIYLWSAAATRHRNWTRECRPLLQFSNPLTWIGRKIPSRYHVDDRLIERADVGDVDDLFHGL